MQLHGTALVMQHDVPAHHIMQHCSSARHSIQHQGTAQHSTECKNMAQQSTAHHGTAQLHQNSQRYLAVKHDSILITHGPA